MHFTLGSIQVISGLKDACYEKLEALFREIVNSFGQGKCTFDWLGISQFMAVVSSHMLRMEKPIFLIIFNMTIVWTFHTNLFLNGYTFHVYKKKYKSPYCGSSLTINIFFNIYRCSLVFFTTALLLLFHSLIKLIPIQYWKQLHLHLRAIAYTTTDTLPK